MARTTEQIDLALAAVETKLVQVYNGVMTTIRQNNLVIEGQLGDLNAAVGAPAEAPNPATGIRNDIAALTTLLISLQTDIQDIQQRLDLAGL